MDFTIRTAGGTEIVMQEDTSIVIEINNEDYEISIQKLGELE